MNIESVTHNDLSFVIVTSPHELECKDLTNAFGIKQLHLDEYVHDQLIPKIEKTESYTVVVLDFPFVEVPGEKPDKQPLPNNSQETQEKESGSILPNVIPKFLFSQSEKSRIRTAHIMFLIGENFVITLHDEKSPDIDMLFRQLQGSLKKREEIMGFGSYYLGYCIIASLVRSAYNVMRGITGMIENIDIYALENNTTASIVEDISLTRRNIVYFRSMIDQSVLVFAEIIKGNIPQFSENTDAHWNNIYSHLQKIRSRLHRSQELLEGISKSHESLITVKTNEIVKILTMFTAILLPLTLVTGFYGMNILGLPKAESSDGLYIISGSMIGLSILMAVLFKIKKWV